jgi:hypothetical protein
MEFVGGFVILDVVDALKLMMGVILCHMIVSLFRLKAYLILGKTEEIQK